MKIIDCKGLICPMPLIETKKTIKESALGEEIQVEVDNETSFNNLSHFLNDNGWTFEYNKEESVYQIRFIVNKLQTKTSTRVAEIKPKSNIGTFIIVLSSNFMGSGNDDLGKLLLKGFLNSIDQIDSLPKEIICYNSGVTLAVKGSDTAQSLKKLEELGVKISLCGTCVDFYGLKENTEIGSITNMLYIAGVLAGDNKIVMP
jgi:selenium metabolism protein YedF